VSARDIVAVALTVLVIFMVIKRHSIRIREARRAGAWEVARARRRYLVADVAIFVGCLIVQRFLPPGPIELAPAVVILFTLPLLNSIFGDTVDLPEVSKGDEETKTIEASEAGSKHRLASRTESKE
jgi:hypothetical protein